MAVYDINLSSASGWTERWNTGYASIGTGTGILRITQTTQGLYGVSNDSIDSDVDRDDVEVLAKVLYTNNPSFSGKSIGVFVRGSGTSSASAYIAYINVSLEDGDKLYLDKYVSGTLTNLGTYNLTTNNPDTYYYIRIRANSTAIKAKLWAASEVEPASWQIEVTDSSVTSAGWVGIHTFDDEMSPYDFASFAVGTNGDEARLTASATLVMFIGV
jgi:hypothetical protein